MSNFGVSQDNQRISRSLIPPRKKHSHSDKNHSNDDAQSVSSLKVHKIPVSGHRSGRTTSADCEVKLKPIYVCVNANQNVEVIKKNITPTKISHNYIAPKINISSIQTKSNQSSDVSSVKSFTIEKPFNYSGTNQSNTVIISEEDALKITEQFNQLTEQMFGDSDQLSQQHDTSSLASDSISIQTDQYSNDQYSTDEYSRSPSCYDSSSYDRFPHYSRRRFRENSAVQPRIRWVQPKDKLSTILDDKTLKKLQSISGRRSRQEEDEFERGLLTTRRSKTKTALLPFDHDLPRSGFRGSMLKTRRPLSDRITPRQKDSSRAPEPYYFQPYFE